MPEMMFSLRSVCEPVTMSYLFGTLCPILYMRLMTFVKICLSVLMVSAILLPCVYLLNVTEEKKVETKTILYWTKMFGNETFYFGEGDIFRGCKISACQATHNRSLMNIEDFDALLFHAIQKPPPEIPKVRSNKQKYIFTLLETPENYGLDSAFLPDHFYNWTMTYRRDSDIRRPYGFVLDSRTNQPAYPLWARPDTVSNDIACEDLQPPRNYAKGKRKTAAWFVSHCQTRSLRERYVEELKRNTDVDIYGKCGRRSCEVGDDKCYRMLESTYYFYISFENSLCDDYVTEKLYKLMAYDVVPIVYGGVNYSEFAPPGSYINVADFKSPRHLANHLSYLIENPDEYAKLFWWKKHFRVDLSHRLTLCQMCEMLHNENFIASNDNNKDIKKWWFEGACRRPEESLVNLKPSKN